MTPTQRNPMWTAFPDPIPEKPVRKGHRFHGTHLLGVPAVVGALVMGVGAGSAYAYFKAHGSRTGHATIGSTATVTVNAVTETDLLPGATVAAFFTLTNSNTSLSATFNQVTAVSVASSNQANCPASNISFPSLPHTISPAVAVGANTTSGTQSIANFVTLSNSAPSACQGVTFTLTLTLSGKSS